MILLVEDDAITRMEMAEALRTSGHQVLEAEDGEEALDLLRGNPVKLVVVDCVMPGIDGLKLMKLLQHRRPDLPIILISGHLSEEVGDVIAATSKNYSKYLSKPVRPSALLRTVQELLG